MAQKKTYLYHMLIGQNDRTEVDCFVAARNCGVAIDYCKEIYKDKKYNSYQAIKVGICHKLEETRILDKEEEMKLRNASADRLEKFSERQIDIPKFIPKEEMEATV